MVRLKSDNDKSIGVLLCDCGGALRKRLDFARLEKTLNDSDDVSSVRVCSDFCDSKECLAAIKSLLKSGTKRLIIGGCSQENYEETLTGILQEMKINDGLWWSVNIYEQSALVHRNKQTATEKVIKRFSAALERVKLAAPIKLKKKKVRQNVVVIGGGIAGLQAAVSIEELGHRVSLMSRAGTLGGMVAAMPELYQYVDYESGDNGSITRFIHDLIEQVKKNRNIQIYSDAALESAKGEPGNFVITVKSNGQKELLQAGAVVLAPGTNRKYALETVAGGILSGVIDMHGLLEMIRTGDVPQRIAIIMDVAGEQDRTVTAQVFTVAELLARSFGVKVKVYCNNVRVAAAGLERLYRNARDAGVIVVKSGKKPMFSVDKSKVAVVYDDPVISVMIKETYDIVVIADRQTADAAHTFAGKIEGLKTGPDDALQYDGVWLLPTLTNHPGVFVIGGARGNSEYREALIDGTAVAGEIHDLLRERQIEVLDDAAVVDSDKCVLCLTCLRICPHGAVSIDDKEGAASISLMSCQRCGICAAECPAQAITLPRFTDDQVTAEIGLTPRVTVFACENSAIPAANKAGMSGYKYQADIEIIKVPCAGRIDVRAVIAALEKGAEKVIVLGCHPESCKYLTGSSRAARRMTRLAAILKKSGFDGSRVVFGGIASMESSRFIEYVTAKETNVSIHSGEMT